MTSVQRPQDTRARLESIERRLGVLERASVPYRTQPATFQGSWNFGATNSWTASLPIEFPAWATSLSLVANGVVTIIGSPSSRISAEIVIDGDVGPEAFDTSFGPESSMPVMHARTWSPATETVTVVIRGGSPISETPGVIAQLAVVALYTKG